MFCRTLSELAIWWVSAVVDRALWVKLIHLWSPFGMDERTSFDCLETSSSEPSDQVDFRFWRN